MADGTGEDGAMDNPLAELASLELYETQSETRADIMIGMDARFGSYTYTNADFTYSVSVSVLQCTLRLFPSACNIDREGRAGAFNQSQNVQVQTTYNETESQTGEKSVKGKIGVALNMIGLNPSASAEAQAGAGSKKQHTTVRKYKTNNYRQSIVATAHDTWVIQDVTEQPLHGLQQPEDGLAKVAKGQNAGSVSGYLYVTPAHLQVDVTPTDGLALPRKSPSKSSILQALVAKELRQLQNVAGMQNKIVIAKSKVAIAAVERHE